jgi:phage antirepressor YoqD-like protein
MTEPARVKAKLATLKKIEQFLEEFKKDSTQSVTLLCKQLKLQKNQLYEHLREKNIVLNDIRQGQNVDFKIAEITEVETEIDNTKSKRSGTVTIEEMQEIVDKIDELKEQGYTVPEAMKKAGIKRHFRAYYNYRDRLKLLNGNKKPTRKRKPTSPPLALPTTPHTVEYIKVESKEKPEKKKDELVLAIGSPDVLLDFIKKMREIN